MATAGALAVAAAYTAAGFWWVEGLLRTRERMLAGEAGDRPYLYFLVANVAALAIAVGPATVAGLRRLRRGSALWGVCGGAVAALAVANLSGMSRGEVERIWLPFTPYLIAATALLPVRGRRWWLAAQLVTGIVVQSLIRSW